MEQLLKEFEDKGYKVIVGWKEKERIKNIRKSIKKIKGKR